MGQLIDKTALRKEMSKLPSEMGTVRKSEVMQSEKRWHMPIGDGRKTYSDSTLKSMTKDKLIDIIRCLENNLKNAYETNDIQYENCQKLLSEERNKAIDDFVSVLAEGDNRPQCCKDHGKWFSTCDICEFGL